MIVDLASGEVAEDRLEPPIPAQEFAREGELRGGKARADALSPERKAAVKRWGKNDC